MTIPEELGVGSARLGGPLGSTGLTQLAAHNTISVGQGVHARGSVVTVVVVVLPLCLTLAPANTET